MSCDHLIPDNVRESIQGVLIYKDECMRCFKSSKDEGGINVCLRCFEGFCPGEHTQKHFESTHHALFTNLKQIPVEVPEEEKKITKLAVGKEGGAGVFAEYDTVATLHCQPCGKTLDKTAQPWATSVIDAVVISKSAYFDNQVGEWEQELRTCKHTEDLNQAGATPIANKNMAHCNDCDFKQNLWLCLTCGNLGCGRQLYDGTGGNGHGLNHYESSKHPVSAKIGTITPDGSASLYCYECDEDVLDKQLGAHLKCLGIEIGGQVKTEKSITEINLEANLNLTLSKVVEDGKLLQPMFGPGFTGLDNLGNSCYMNSVLQVLFSIDEIRDHYFSIYESHHATCAKKTSECFDCQFSKLAHGLFSGEFSHKKISKPVEFEGMSEEDKKEQEYQDGIRPQMFKTMVGKGHQEFSSGRQQDAQEYFDHLRAYIDKGERAAKRTNPMTRFDFELQEKFKCRECNGCKVKKVKTNQLNLILLPEEGMEIDSVELSNSLERFFAPVEISMNCSACNKSTTFSKTQRFLNFPKTLMMTMQRFTFADWVPKKVTTSLDTAENVDLDQYKVAEGLEEGETALPEAAEEEIEVEPDFNADFLNAVIGMGIPELTAKHALLQTGQSSAEVAVQWYFENMDSPVLQTPIPKVKKIVGGGDEPQEAPVSEESIMMLSSMGFPAERCTKALKKCDGDMERAADYLMNHAEDDDEEEGVSGDFNNWEPCQKPGKYDLSGLITHLGASVHSGHYVAHCKKEGKWYLYNDAKVAESVDAPVDKAFIYYWTKE